MLTRQQRIPTPIACMVDHRDLVAECTDHVGVEGLLVGNEETYLHEVLPTVGRPCETTQARTPYRVGKPQPDEQPFPAMARAKPKPATAMVRHMICQW